eukprot:4074613-Amphidinium_carterae.1
MAKSIRCLPSRSTALARLQTLRGFFRLPEPLWAGFLAGWPTLPGNENHEVAEHLVHRASLLA